MPDGSPRIVYPGSGGLAVALPANASDALYTRWAKPTYNPIIPATVAGARTGDDPSTAWRTKFGEWRFVDNSVFEFASADFKSWHIVGNHTLPVGECASFFDLPPLSPGFSPADYPAGSLPNKVHMGGRPTCQGDCVQLGTWVDGRPGRAGTWAATPNVSHALVLIDGGQLYSAKDFWDEAKQRRVLLAAVSASYVAQTLPRVITYHPLLRRLVFTPLPELASLREPTPLAVLKHETQILPNESLSLSSIGPAAAWTHSKGNASELFLNVTLPKGPRARAASFGARVMMGSGGIEAAEGLDVRVAFSCSSAPTPPPPTPTPPPLYRCENNSCVASSTGAFSHDECVLGCGPMRTDEPQPVAACTATLSAVDQSVYRRFMGSCNLPAGDFNDTGMLTDVSQYSACQASCDRNERCTCWQVVGWNPATPNPQGFKSLCILKDGYPQPAFGGAQSCGVKDPGVFRVRGGVRAEIPLLPGDATMDLRIFVDSAAGISFAEVFVLGGRTALTVEVRSPLSS